MKHMDNIVLCASIEIAIEALENGQPKQNRYPEARDRHANALAALRREVGKLRAARLPPDALLALAPDELRLEMNAAYFVALAADAEYSAAIRRQHGANASRWDKLPDNKIVEDALMRKYEADAACHRLWRIKRGEVAA